MNDSEVTGETTTQLARQARIHFQADIGIAVDGYYSSETAPAIGDVFIAVDTEADKGVITPGYPGNPQLVIRRTISQALVYLREFILKQKDFPTP
jgi:nicotinamide mononucleotide (NMN) deamidase PncC